jgi:hypothetical protein
MHKARKKLVIAGGGTAGWMAANLFAKNWANLPIDIVLVESPEIGIIGVGEGSTPNLKRFFEILDIAEHDWMPKCNATYKLNIEFHGWSPQSGIASYSHPFSSQVDTFTYKAFNVNCRTRRLGLDTNTRPADFFLNSVLSEKRKLPHTPENFPFVVEYGYHFDSYLLGEYLCTHAKGMDVEHIQQKIVSVNTHENGDISSLSLDNEQTLDADFFVDCTGFASLLIGKTLNTSFTSFSDNLFNDSAVVFPTPPLDKLPLETKATALSSGWAWQIPLVNRTGNGYVYSSRYLSAQAAEDELRTHLGLNENAEARHLKMRVGQMEKHWSHNCLALGLAQGFIEPLEATALHLVQVTCEMFAEDVINHFDDSMSTSGFSRKGQTAFNESMRFRFERVRDYIVAHYKLNTRDDSQYWIDNRNNEHLSESLQKILHAWFTNQDMLHEINTQQLNYHFDVNSWNCILSGYGVFPPLANKQPGTGDLYIEQNIQSFLNACAMNFASFNN